jgi:hypothetical protein
MRFSWWCRRTWRGIITQGAKAPAAPRCTTESLQYITSQLKRNSNPDALGSVPPQVAGNASSIIRPAFRVLRSVSYRQGGRDVPRWRTYVRAHEPVFWCGTAWLQSGGGQAKPTRAPLGRRRRVHQNNI